VVTPPTPAALHALDLLLGSLEGRHLLEGAMVPTKAVKGMQREGYAVRELVFYGRGSRPGRFGVIFSPDTRGVLAGTLEAQEAGEALFPVPDSVSGPAARLLLSNPSDAAFGDALMVLLRTRPEEASGAALRVVREPRGASAGRRLAAAEALHALGGRRVYPEEFRRLAEDPDREVREIATR